MDEKFGIENTKKVFKLVIDAGNEVGILLDRSDEAFLNKLAKSPWLDIVRDVVAIIGVNWKTFIREVQDLDADELNELKQFLIANFSIPQENTEKVIVRIIDVLMLVGMNVKEIISISKEFSQPAL
jgi:hypothetical protein